MSAPRGWPAAAARNPVATAATAALAALLATGAAHAEPVVDALAALGDGHDVIVFEEGARVLAATRVKAPPRVVRAVLLDPSTWREVVPALARADVVGSTVTGGRAAAAPRLVSWRLGIPVFNLTGRLTVSVTADDVIRFEFSEGALAPGRFELRALPDGGRGTALVAEGAANLCGAHWLLRRLCARSRLAEPAMAATAAFILVRATGLYAEHPTETDARRPHGPMEPPAAAALDGLALAGVALAPLRARGVLAVVQRTPAGRLRHVAVAVATTATPAATHAHLADPASTKALPGWREIDVTRERTRLVVDADLAFTDFDATWDWRVAKPLGPVRAQAIDGSVRGAVMGWDVAPTPGGTLAVLSLHPRLDASGWMPRRFIEAEPLLEHGMALALAYVDALAETGPLGLKAPGIRAPAPPAR